MWRVEEFFLLQCGKIKKRTQKSKKCSCGSLKMGNTPTGVGKVGKFPTREKIMDKNSIKTNIIEGHYI